MWPPTMSSLAASKLEALAKGLGLQRLVPEALSVLEVLGSPWLDWSAGGSPAWDSDLTDDGSPLEFSVAFDGNGPSLRLLTEAQGEGRDASASWRAGQEVNRRLAASFDVDLERLTRVSPLFAPDNSRPQRFATWHGAVLDGAKPPAFKIYLDPRCRGRAGARWLIDEALRRLGLPEARKLLAALPAQWSPLYFSLDISAELGERCKVYLVAPDTSPSSLSATLAAHGLAQRNAVEHYLAELIGARTPLDARPVQLCLAFHAGEAHPQLTLHAPVRSFVANDRHALELACRWLTPEDAAVLTAGVEAMAQRPLEAGRSLISYVSLRPRSDRLGVTVYLSPQLYAVAAPREVPSFGAGAHSFIREISPRHEASQTTMGTLLNEIEARRRQLSEKPFLTRVRREGDQQRAKAVARRMAFWVMGFQDILRLVTRLTTDEELASLAATHEAEDSGHDHWFLHDLERMGVDISLRDLFDHEAEIARDTVYQIVSDVLTAQDDRARLCVVLALEAAGVEYFSATIAFLQRVGVGEGLLYFARSHQQVEASHDVFEATNHGHLARVPVSAEAHAEAMRVIARIFAAMETLGDELFSWLDDGKPLRGAGV